MTRYKDFCHCGCQVNRALLYLTTLTDPGCRSPPPLKLKDPTWGRRLEEVLAGQEDARQGADERHARRLCFWCCQLRSRGLKHAGTPLEPCPASPQGHAMPSCPSSEMRVSSEAGELLSFHTFRRPDLLTTRHLSFRVSYITILR